ncbi:MAG TPA: hypothetical protein VGQ12_03035 [Candidatus Angelobacter sp.]|jgi:hypothetical protein|nr:hypothetical protein [Candidatus Angelobacter sp.]
MPLARIFTRNPERTTDLSSQLKQQGYSVEVTRPDQANLAPADLEIEFEICERSDVLDRAADLASELGADVAVAPGVLQMAAKPVAEPILAAPVVSEPIVSQKVVAQTETEKVLHLESNVTVEHDPEREFEAAFAPVIQIPVPAVEMPAPAMQASQEVIDVPVMEQEQMPPVAFLEESPAVEPVAAAPMAEHYREASATPSAERYSEVPVAFSEPVRPADPMPYLAQLTPFSGRASRTPELNMEERQSPVPSVRPQDPAEVQVPGKQLRSKKVLQDGARVAAHTWAGALALAASTKASVRDHFEEYRKRAQVRSAEARAEHAARLLDLEQRRAEAHQRAAELEIAREQAAAKLMELVRQREPGVPPERLRERMAFEPSAPVQGPPSQSFYIPPPARDREREVPLVAASKREPAAKSKRAAMTATPIELWRGINPPLRAVLTGAAAVTALFIMGIALGVFHSNPPLASTASHSSNGVTVQTGGVTVPAAPVKGQAPQTVATTQAKPQPGQTASSAETQSAGTVAKPSPRVRQTRLVAEQSEKQIGDDVVIRHYSRPLPTQKPKQTGQQAGLKHFSDLEN